MNSKLLFRVTLLLFIPVGIVVTILGDLWNDDRSADWWHLWRNYWL